MLEAIRTGSFYVVLAMGFALLIALTALVWYWALNQAYHILGMSKEFFHFLLIRRRGNAKALRSMSPLLASQEALILFDETPLVNHRKREDLLRAALAAARRADRQMKEK